MDIHPSITIENTFSFFTPLGTEIQQRHLEPLDIFFNMPCPVNSGTIFDSIWPAVKKQYLHICDNTQACGEDVTQQLMFTADRQIPRGPDRHARIAWHILSPPCVCFDWLQAQGQVLRSLTVTRLDYPSNERVRHHHGSMPDDHWHLFSYGRCYHLAYYICAVLCSACILIATLSYKWQPIFSLLQSTDTTGLRLTTCAIAFFFFVNSLSPFLWNNCLFYMMQ